MSAQSRGRRERGGHDEVERAFENMTPNAAPQTQGPRAEASTALLQRLVDRTRDYDNRVGAGLTLAIAVAVLLLGSIPLRAGLELDLREGDDVGGWNQLTLVGFTVAQSFGRSIPDQPGRQDLRIVSNRPLPSAFDVELEGWWIEAQPEGELEIAVDERWSGVSFGTEPTTASVRLQNPGGARTIRLRLSSAAELAVRRIAVRPAEPPQ